MIDFHSHILPNIDDGSKSIEETFNLIKEAQDAGFTGVISTSHYMEGYYQVDAKERGTWIKAIGDNLETQNINIKLYLGSEVYFSQNIVRLLEEGKASTINNTSYVLFEFPMNVKPMNIYDVIYEMLQYKLVPILAHPERYTFVQEEPDLIYDLIDKGVLMQGNYASIIGYYGKKAKVIMRKLLENDMIHFLGTDVHRQRSIYKKMPQILTELEEIVGKSKLYELTTINPGLVLENKKIEIANPSHLKISLKDIIMMNLK